MTEVLAALRRAAAEQPDNWQAQMRLAEALHASGKLSEALDGFVRARLLLPGDENIASACATVLCELGRPQEAYDLLGTYRDELLQSADGATNLAVVAELYGKEQEAVHLYEHALSLDTRCWRALNNLARLEAREGQWELAVEHMRQCVALEPRDASRQGNLADLLIGARDYRGAAHILAMLAAGLPQEPVWRLKLVVAHAFAGDFALAQAALAMLGSSGPAQLRDFLQSRADFSHRSTRKPILVLPSMAELFTQQAFEGMQVCDWRQEGRLVEVLLDLLNTAQRPEAEGVDHDWRDTQFYALMLPLTEMQQTEIRRVTDRSLLRLFPRPKPLPVRARGAARKLRIGIATQTLRDERHLNGLVHQLRLHDRSKFDFYLYSPTPSPTGELGRTFDGLIASHVDLGSMSDDAATERVRQDELDLWLDTAFYTPWCRVELVFRRVCQIQIFTQTWKRYHPDHPDIPCEYSIGDEITHPGEVVDTAFGPIVRLPYSCWLATNTEEAQEEPLTRTDVGLPVDSFVFCSWVPALAIDPHTFTAWMAILKAVPRGVLWLAPMAREARNNLWREAKARGVDPSRIYFAAPAHRRLTLAKLRLADLFLDPLRFNANHGLVDALRMNVPALTVTGRNQASRLGSSILRAAGLPGGVMHDVAQYQTRAIELASDQQGMQSFSDDLAQGLRTGPMWNTAARIREWESMWTLMIERQRDGLAAKAFDVAAWPAN